MRKNSVRLREPAEQVLQRMIAYFTAVMMPLWFVVLMVAFAILPESMDVAFWEFHVPVTLIGIAATAFTWVMVWAVQLVPARWERSGPGSPDPSDTATHLRRELNSDYGEIRNMRLAAAMVASVALLSLVEIPYMASVPGTLAGYSPLIEGMSYMGATLLSVVCTILVATFMSEVWPWVYVLAATLARVPWAFDSFGYDPVVMRHSIAMALIAMSFAVMQVFYLRAVARAGDKALNESTEAVVRSTAQTSTAAEAARIDGLVHDHILAALLLASRADDPQDAPYIRRSAAHALAALSEISAPTADQAGTVECSVEAFATRLFQDAREEDPTIQTAGRGTCSTPLPGNAATALRAAALEAVRNSLKHADGGMGQAVTRRLVVHAEEGLLRVIVSDDGVGFDPSTATKGRYGVIGSIVGRLTDLDGGSATVDSAPGEGTVITLTWEDKGAALTRDRQSGKTNMAKSLTGHDVVTQQYFSQLEGMAVETIPVGTHLRAITVMTLGFLYLIIDTLDCFNPIWFSPVAALVFIVGFGITLFPLIKDPTNDPPPIVGMYSVVFAPLILVGSLLFWDSPQRIELHNWAEMLIYVAIMGLGFSNYPRMAWSVAVSAAAVFVGWSVITSAALPIQVVVLTLMLPLGVNRLQRVSFLLLIDSASRAAEFRKEADARTRDLMVFLARRQRGKRVDTLARPLLERLAAGERTIAPVRVEAAQLEAHLRDDLRARCFRDTDVTRAANDARRAGVRVDLMDDGGLDDAPIALRERVIDAATEALDASHEGAVIVRIAPPGRDVAATILMESKVGDTNQTKRLEIPTQPDGSLQEEQQ